MGELIYAMVVCHFDLGYSLSFLSCFTTTPTTAHYVALKCVCCYLHPCALHGIVYWHKQPWNDLPVGTFTPLALDPELSTFPKCNPFKLSACVDAAHATALQCHSVTGHVISYAGGTIAY